MESLLWILTLWIGLGLPLALFGYFIVSIKMKNSQKDFSEYEQLSQELFQGLERISRHVEHQAIQTIKELHTSLGVVRESHHQSLAEHRQEITTPIAGLSAQFQQLQQWEQSLSHLTHKIHQLSRILDHTTLKGKFGEKQLEILLKDRYPESWILTQPLLPTGVRADFGIAPSDQDLLLVIDSKFPVQSFKVLLEDLSNAQYRKDFITVMKKNITDIATKYILPQITYSHALLFVPSSHLFIQLMEFNELFDFAQKHKVLICCPQSLYWMIDLMKEHHFHHRWTKEQRSYFQYLSRGQEVVEHVLEQWEQWDKRCTQLRLDGRHLRKELAELQSFFEDLYAIKPRKQTQEQPDESLNAV